MSHIQTLLRQNKASFKPIYLVLNTQNVILQNLAEGETGKIKIMSYSPWFNLN